MAAWKSIMHFLLKGRKQALIAPTVAWGEKKTGNHNILQKASILCLLFLSGIASKWHNQTAEQPSVWQTGMRNHSSLSAGWLSRAARQNRSHIVVPLYLPPLRIRARRAQARTDPARFMAEDRPICVARLGAAGVTGGRMDGSARGAVTVALCSIEGGNDYVYLEGCVASRSSGGGHLMEPCDRDELTLRRSVRGRQRGRWAPIERHDARLSDAFLCTLWYLFNRF